MNTQVTVDTDDRTRFRRKGPAELADFVAGDWLLVTARACKPPKAQNAPTTTAVLQVLAKMVVAKPKKSGTTTTTTTATS